MIDLNSARWSSLTHAYGAAGDIPALLQQLADHPYAASNDPEQEPWFSLWSALCHQGDVYPASYAAVPHIIAIAASLPTLPACDFFWLPTSIEIARLGNRGPAIPKDLIESYFAALHRFHDIAYRFADTAWDADTGRAIAAALLVAKGHALLAEAILELSPEAIALFREQQGL